MARKPFMEMDLEEFEDNNIVGDIDEPSLDFDFDIDEETTPDEDTSDIITPPKYFVLREFAMLFVKLFNKLFVRN